MFMHIVTQLSGRIMALYTQVLEWLEVQLWRRVKPLLASFIRVFQNVRNLYLLNLLRVQTVSSFNRFRVSLITAAQLIKAGLSTAKAKLIQTGQQLATIAHQTLQRVKTLFKKGN
jgi:ABC-type metal ion transport system substrate-binding protein